MDRSRPKLLINASRIGEVGGLRTFTEGLLQCFEGCPNVEVLAPGGIALKTSLHRIGVPAYLASSARVSRWRPILWYLYSLLDFPSDRQTKILSATHHAVPRRKHQVIVLHDLRPFFYPDTFVQKFNFHYLLPRALRRCDGILTVSEASKDQIAKVYGISRENIHVIAQQVRFPDITALPESDKEAPYLLTVGSTWPHKNVEELLQMHHRWAPRYRLRIVGGRGQYMDRLAQMATSLGLEHRVSFFSDLSKDEMNSMFASCSGLVYPSLLEGFGLPPFEAMALGKPVILSDIPVFRELHGDIPIYVQLNDEQSWADAFLQLESFPRHKLDQGIERAKAYSAQRMLQSLFIALEQIWGKEFLRSCTSLQDYVPGNLDRG